MNSGASEGLVVPAPLEKTFDISGEHGTKSLIQVKTLRNSSFAIVRHRIDTGGSQWLSDPTVIKYLTTRFVFILQIVQSKGCLYLI